MIAFSYTVTDDAGIHARPAGALIKMVRDSDCDVAIKKDDKTADGKKIFTVMALGVKCGDTVTVEISGKDEQILAEKIQAFMQENL